MQVFDLFNTDYERRLTEGSVDRLEQRRIDDLNMKMDELANRVKSTSDPAHKKSLLKAFLAAKEERDSYYKVKTNEGSMKRQMEADAERLSREQFCDLYGDEHGEFWDNIMGELDEGKWNYPDYMTQKANQDDEAELGISGRNKDRRKEWRKKQKAQAHKELMTGKKKEQSVDEAGIGHDIADKKEKIARATPQTKAGAVASTVKNAAKWLAGKGGPGKEGPTYEGEELDEKLKGLPSKKLGSARDIGKSVKKFRAQRGLEEAGTADQWSKEGEWKAIPKAKSGKPADPRGEVTHLSDVARREAEHKADQKKNSEEVEEGWSDAIVAQRTGRPRTPYSVYIKGKKWKDFENEDHAEAVANKLRAKFKAEGRDPSVITIAATDYDKGMDEAANPAQQAAIAIAMKKAGKKPKTDEALRDPWNEKHFGPGKVVQKIFKVKADNGKSYNIKAATEQQAKETLQKHAPDANIVSIKFVSNVMNEDHGSWIVYDPKTKQIKKRFKTHTAGKSYAKTHGLGFASSEYYFDRVKEPVNELNIDTLKSYADKRGAQVAAMKADNPNAVAGSKEWSKQAVPAQKVGRAKQKISRAERQQGVEEEKTRLDPKCWKGKKIGNPKTKMKGGVRVNNCVPAEEGMFSPLEENNEARDAVESAIIRRIMVAHKDLLMKFGPQKVMDAAAAIADDHSDVEEIGTSDVSAYVHQVERYLAMNH